MANQPQQDKRRFNAPEGARPLEFAPHASTSKLNILDDAGQREDGRAPGEVRGIYLKTGLVTQASGSAYIETGKTKLICAVYGPKPTPASAPFNPKARLNVEVKFAPFSSGVRRFVPGKDTEALSLSLTLQQSLLPSLILDALPKSQIDLFVTILESDGSDSDISAGVTAASVALAEAGIQMFGLVTGSYAAFLYNNSEASPTATALLDPTGSESRRSTAFVSLACIPAMGTITNVGMRGVVDTRSFEAALDECFKVCGQIHAVSKAALVEGAEARELVGELLI